MTHDHPSSVLAEARTSGPERSSRKDAHRDTGGEGNDQPRGILVGGAWLTREV
jgi:hypothetical protein